VQLGIRVLIMKSRSNNRIVRIKPAESDGGRVHENITNWFA
jgi:hypothetical protein